MKPVFIIIISTILLSSGCKKEVEFKGKDLKPKIVLNSIIYVDSIIQCHISKSNIATSGSFAIKPLTNANVVLSEDGVIVDTMIHTATGKYLSNITALDGKVYKIHVSLASYNDAIGTSQLIKRPKWLTIDSIGIISQPYESIKMIMFRLKIPKEEGNTNYYSMKVYRQSVLYSYDQYTYDIIDSVIEYRPVEIDMEYAHGIEFEKYHYEEVYSLYKYFFTDKITSTENEGIIEFPVANSYDANQQRHYLFVIEQVSKDLFLYEHSLSLLFDNSTPTLFSQPVQTYMNIEGGLGIIGTSIVLPNYYYPAQ